MQFIRAPDENVYIAPLNLVEIVISGLCEWWMPKHAYEVLNDIAMGVMYSPLLVVAAFFETRKAAEIRWNRSRGEDDDDVEEEWEQMAQGVDLEAEGWTKICDAAKSNVEEDPAIVEVQKLRGEIEELKAMLAEVTKAVGADSPARDKQGDHQAGGSGDGDDTAAEDSKGKAAASSSSSAT
jgi:hypothetical protein